MAPILLRFIERILCYDELVHKGNSPLDITREVAEEVLEVASNFLYDLAVKGYIRLVHCFIYAALTIAFKMLYDDISGVNSVVFNNVRSLMYGIEDQNAFISKELTLAAGIIAIEEFPRYDAPTGRGASACSSAAR
jgi:hypothetical protein